jgi:N-acetylglucosamine kinase-like BadF-type ATPase
VREAAEIPSWAGRAAKAEIAALVPVVLAAAEAGDGVALDILQHAARELALHAAALAERLAPWSEEPPVVLFGGVFGSPYFRELVARALTQALPGGVRVCEASEDAVRGALRMAARLLAAAPAAG